MSNELVLTEREKQYFELLFDKNMGVDAALSFMREQNQSVTRQELLRFKQKTLGALIDMQRDEHMAELVLTSFERVKIEFNDLITETKAVLNNSKDNDPQLTLAAIRELRAQLETSLNQQNKQAEQLIGLINEKKKDKREERQFHELLKQEKERWFDEYKCMLNESKQLVFTNPTPELVDMFVRWKFQKEMKEGTLGAINV
jgi:hypothetical protein